jgi:hypothetical protein
LHYDASAAREGLFNSLGRATLEGVEYVQGSVVVPFYTVNNGGNESNGGTIDRVSNNDVGGRIARLLQWELASGSFLRPSLTKSCVAYQIEPQDVAGTGHPQGPEWFSVPEITNFNWIVFEGRGTDTVKGIVPVQETGDLAIEAKLLESRFLRCSFSHPGTGQAMSVLVPNVLRVKHNGQWINFRDALSHVDAAKLHAVVSGRIAGEDYVAATAGSLTKTTNDSVTVVLTEETPGEVRVFIHYGSTADNTFANVAYAVTFVNEWAEESAPTAPEIVERDISRMVRITSTYKGFPDGKPATGMNVYRTYATGDAYLLVNKIPIPPQEDGSWLFDDASNSPQTSTALATAEWDPPNPNMHSLTYAGNGFFAGAVGKDLVFSEPYHPHAWPYAMTFPHAIVGLEAVENGLLATTLERPYIVYGAHPEQMTQQIINAEQAGVTQRSMTRAGGNAVYVSNDGMVEVSGGLASLTASQNLFTRQDWRREYLPRFRNIALGAHDGALVGIIDPESPTAAQNREGFIIRLDEAAAGSCTRFSLDPSPLGVSLVPEIDALFLCFPNGFAEYGAGSDLPFFWRSRDFEFPQPVNFGAVVVDCSPGLHIAFYVNGEKKYEKEIGDGESSFRLPSFAPQKTWAVEFSGKGTLRRFEMATSFAELKAV